MTTYRTPRASAKHISVWGLSLLVAVLLLALFAIAPLAPTARGASESLEQQLEQKVAAAEQANDKYQALVKDLESLQKDVDSCAARLAELDEQITGVQNDIDQAELDLAVLRVQIEDRLVNIYKDGGSWSMHYLEALLVEENLTDILSRFYMLSKLADQDETLFTQVEDYLDESKTNKTLLEQKQAEQQTELDGLVLSQNQLAAKKTQAWAQKQRLDAQVATLNTQIAQAKAAAAAARLKAVSDSANKASNNVGTPTGGGSSGAGYPGSAAQVSAQARFIEKTYLEPRKSALSGMQVMELWRKYGMTPAQSLAVLNAESGMGSLKYGGRLVSEGNNFGCMTYSSSPSWASWSPPISFGKIYVADRYWMKFYSVADGIEAWGRYIAYGRGRDCYRPLMRTGNWAAFADIYYGTNAAGKAKYIERVTWAYDMLKRTSAAAGYSW